MPRKSPTIVSTLISAGIDKLAPRMTQRELSVAMGFSTPNMLSMLRTGDAKVPFTKIPVIAAVLDIDPALLLRFHLREQWPEFESVVFEIFGGVLTRKEREWIEFFGDLDLPKVPTSAVKRKELMKLLKDL
ncbi:MAG: helix-turn-helix transcriptional regulator [Aestuariivirga sp.]